jgi:hypothetical protein
MNKKRQMASAIIEGTVAAAAISLSSSGAAFEFDTGTDLKARWDNTVKYSSAWRLSDPSSNLLANINGDDGNRNFNTGLISSRVDLLSELDLTYRSVGLRISGAAWYDAMYNRSNNNDSPATANALSVASTEFPDATRRLHGRKAEILDAFLFGNGRINDMQASFRAGRHTLLWGESLLLATNGISYGQAPLDLIKALAVPASQAKELFMPVGQVSGQVAPSSALSFAGYYQFEWRRTRLPGVGSYFSSTDVLDAGGERLLLAPPPGPALSRAADLSGDDTGQWGISARYRSIALDTDFGIYYLRFNDKLPQVYLRPGALNYTAVYPENIKVLGASFSTEIGSANVAGEIHVRRNTPLSSRALVVPAGTSPDNHDNPLYAVGNSVHAQLSVIYVLTPSALWEAGSISAEIGALRRTSVTKNAGNLDPARDRNAWGFSLRFAPQYFQVLPSVDLTVPVALSYNPKGRTPVPGVFSGHHAGTLSIGFNTEYRKIWNANLQYTTFFGGKAKLPVADQPLADRRFVSLSIQRTF